ncbi:MAG: LytR C-terminal domain-containing protein [Candidatus Dojkabacteria bacterium]
MTKHKSNLKNNSILNKIFFYFRNTKISNAIVKSLRSIRSTQKKELPTGKLKIPKITLPKNTRGLLIPTFILLLVILIIYSFTVYFAISPKGYLTVGSDNYRKRVFDSSINIAYIGFESRLNSYKYVKYLNIVSVDSKNSLVKVYGISPNFKLELDGEEVTIESIWNNIQTDDSIPKIDSVITEIQKYLGLRLDRYVAFDTDNLKNYINDNKITDVARDTFSIDGRLFTQGDILAGDDLFNYLFDKTQDRDVITIRQINFQKSFLEGIKGPIKNIRNLISFKDFSNIFNTNLTREEYIGFLSNLDASEIVFSNSRFLSDKYGTHQGDPLDKSVDPDFNLMDENISAYYRDIDIMKEQAAIEVYNATDQPGLAGNRRRFFQNLGANVVKFGNYPLSDVQTTLLYVPSKNVDLYKNNIIMIQKILRGNVKITFEDYKYNYSGDLILVMGKDSVDI